MELSVVRPKLDGLASRSLSKEDNKALTSPFPLEELDRVVAQCDKNKGSGPYGFNCPFFKRF